MNYSHHPHLFDAFKAFCDDVEAQRGQPGYKSMTGEYVGDGLPDGHEEAFFWVGKKGTPSCDVLDHFSFGLWLKQKGGSQ